MPLLLSLLSFFMEGLEQLPLLTSSQLCSVTFCSSSSSISELHRELFCSCVWIAPSLLFLWKTGVTISWLSIFIVFCSLRKVTFEFCLWNWVSLFFKEPAVGDSPNTLPFCECFLELAWKEEFKACSSSDEDYTEFWSLLWNNEFSTKVRVLRFLQKL